MGRARLGLEIPMFTQIPMSTWNFTDIEWNQSQKLSLFTVTHLELRWPALKGSRSKGERLGCRHLKKLPKKIGQQGPSNPREMKIQKYLAPPS